jgi:hypothetical protein
MDEHEPTEFRTGETWLRLVVMLVYFFMVFYVVKFLVGVSMLFQFVLVVFRGSVNIRLKKIYCGSQSFCIQRVAIRILEHRSTTFPVL